MTTFATRVAGIPCQCCVTYATPYRPMVITGTGYGDAEPPEEIEFGFEILDRHGHRAPWLEAKLTEDDPERLHDEYLTYLEIQNEPY